MVWELGVWFPFQIQEELWSPAGQWRLKNKTDQLASVSIEFHYCQEPAMCVNRKTSQPESRKELSSATRQLSWETGRWAHSWEGHALERASFWHLSSSWGQKHSLLLICCYVSNLNKAGKVSSSATAKEGPNCLASPSRSAQWHSLSPEYSHLLPET